VVADASRLGYEVASLDRNAEPKTRAAPWLGDTVAWAGNAEWRK